MCESHLIHSRDNTETQQDKYTASKWSDGAGGRWLGLWIHVTKPQKGHIHTQHPMTPRPPPRSEHPWYLWETFLIIRFLGITNQTKEKTQHQNLHLVALVVLLERVRGFQLLERMRIGTTSCRIIMLSWHVMNQWLFPQGCTGAIFNTLLGSNELFWHFVL